LFAVAVVFVARFSAVAGGVESADKPRMVSNSARALAMCGWWWSMRIKRGMRPRLCC
jgi:hypothetical protein